MTFDAAPAFDGAVDDDDDDDDEGDEAARNIAAPSRTGNDISVSVKLRTSASSNRRKPTSVI